MKKLANQIGRVGLIGNSEKISCSSLIVKAAKLIARAGRTACCDAATAEMTGLKLQTFPDALSLTQAVDLVLVFGGDGTMLRVAREVAGSAPPILGINVGGLGFLTAAASSDMTQVLRQVWNGEFTLESRPLMEVTGECCGVRIKRRAMNDFVISRGIVSRLISLDVSVDDELLTRYRCDGLIVSSPTGSTAYSLSAGGAVVHPAADVFAITPICPHTLSNRSVIVNLNARIRVQVVTPKPDTYLSADGEGVSEMNAGDSVIIGRSKASIRLMHLKGRSFFETLSRKLHWRGTNV